MQEAWNLELPSELSVKLRGRDLGTELRMPMTGQRDSSGVDCTCGDCWEYLQTVKTLNEFHLNSLSTYLTKYLT